MSREAREGRAATSTFEAPFRAFFLRLLKADDLGRGSVIA
jgi:hypothetical protein